MCSQQFAEFEKLIHDLNAVVLADLKGHFFHAARHHLKQAHTMGIFLKVTHHMLDKVAQDILHSTPGNSSVQVSPFIPVQYVWAQQILQAELEGTGLKVHAVAEVDVCSVGQDETSCLASLTKTRAGRSASRNSKDIFQNLVAILRQEQQRVSLKTRQTTMK